MPYTTTWRFNINIVQNRNVHQKYFFHDMIFGKICIITCFIVQLCIDKIFFIDVSLI